MRVSARFHPSADWPGVLPDEAFKVDMPSTIASAYSHISTDLPVAARLYSVREALEASADVMLRQLMSCVLAADCWAGRLASPRGRFGEMWSRHFGVRMEAVKQALSAALARSTVLARIPTYWIAQEHVRTGVQAAVAGTGIEADLVEMQLIPPVLGGPEWVRRDCGDAVGALVENAAEGPVAAILHWGDRTAVAIVVSNAGRLKAFGTAFGPRGALLDAKELTGATVVSAAEPQLTSVRRCLRAFGLHWLAWWWIRRWRLLVGANPLAAV